MALSAFCPVTATFRSPMGGRRALPGPLLSAVGTGHWAIAPRAPLLPLSVHWGANRNPTSVEKDGRQKGEVGVVSYFLFPFSEQTCFLLTMTLEQSKHVPKRKKKAPYYHLSACQGFLNWTNVWALSQTHHNPQIHCVWAMLKTSPWQLMRNWTVRSSECVCLCMCETSGVRRQTIPGHRAMLQSLVWVSGPSQARPPCWGGAHILVLVRWPRPHVKEHRLHGDHSSHTPCTAGTEKASGLIDVPPCPIIKHPITNCSLPLIMQNQSQTVNR